MRCIICRDHAVLWHSLLSVADPLSARKTTNLRAAVRIDHCHEKSLDDLALRIARLLQCLADAAGLWRSQRQRKFPPLVGWVKFALPPIVRSRELHDISRLDQL